jgi:hypothetical protein
MTFAGCAGSDKAVTAAIAFLRVSGQSFSDGSECLSHSSPRSIRSGRKFCLPRRCDAVLVHRSIFPD